MLNSLLQHEFWLSLEYLPVAEQIGATWLFPLINSLHVLSICFMLGALLMLDLRIAGLSAKHYGVAQLEHDFLPLIWIAFVVAVVTGAALFITRASAHILNPAFQMKIVLMLIAGINMALFHLCVRRGRWPRLVAASGLVSLALWCGVMLAGRWMGHII
jgi:hypothetical protein